MPSQADWTQIWKDIFDKVICDYGSGGEAIPSQVGCLSGTPARPSPDKGYRCERRQGKDDDNDDGSSLSPKQSLSMTLKARAEA